MTTAIIKPQWSPLTIALMVMGFIIFWPLGLAVAFVISGLSVTAPSLRPAAYNVLLVLAFFFVLQGMAVVAFYANRLAGPPFLRAAVWESTASWAAPSAASQPNFDWAPSPSDVSRGRSMNIEGKARG